RERAVRVRAHADRELLLHREPDGGSERRVGGRQHGCRRLFLREPRPAGAHGGGRHAGTRDRPRRDRRRRGRIDRDRPAMSIRSVAWSAARVGAASVALGVLAARAAVEAPRSRARRRNGTRPRLVYGPTPIISIKYMGDAMRRRGYEATTFVYGVASINQ